MQQRSKLVLLIVLILLGVTLWYTQRPSPTPASPSPVRVALKDRQVTLQVSDLPGLLAKPTDWWPAFPEVNTLGAYPDPLPGEQGYVVTKFTHVDNTDEYLESVAVLFATTTAARKGFASLTDTPEARTVNTAGWTGDECRYLSEKRGKLFTSTLRFRKDDIVGRMTVVSATGYQAAETLLKYTRPILARMRHAELPSPVPDAIARLLPSADAVPHGTETYTMLAPAESWALVETTGTPRQMLAVLQKGGVRQLAIRGYRLNALRYHRLDATLFRFKDAASATAWVKRSMKPSEPASLPTGKVVPQPAWLHYYKMDDDIGSAYEYQFCNGRDVCDVSCYAPLTKTDPSCGDIARGVAERWYQSLRK